MLGVLVIKIQNIRCSGPCQPLDPAIVCASGGLAFFIDDAHFIRHLIVSEK